MISKKNIFRMPPYERHFFISLGECLNWSIVLLNSYIKTV